MRPETLGEFAERYGEKPNPLHAFGSFASFIDAYRRTSCGSRPGEDRVMKGRVFVVGSVNADTIITCPRLPAPGETVIAHGLHTQFGGKGGNQAVASARLGAPTTLIAQVGSDSAGTEAINDLQAAGVDVSAILIDPNGHTGQATVLLSDDGENSIVVVPGANDALSAPHVSTVLNERSLRRADVVLVSAEIPEQCAVAAAEACAATGASLLYNVAPYRPLGAWVDQHRPTLILNEVEAAQAASNVGATDAVTTLARTAGSVVVTRGSRGAILARDSTNLVTVTAPAVPVVDTTGAGDAFCGAFAALLAAGADQILALRTAVTAGSYAVTGIGARGALARPDDLPGLLVESEQTRSQ